MIPRASLLFLLLAGFAATPGPAASPPLLARALDRWAANHQDVSFTQQTRFFTKDGALREERLERFDPSRPDAERWQLLEVNGAAPTDEQRQKLEGRKNSRARPKVDAKPGDYLDLDHARVVSETAAEVRYQIPLRPEAQHLINVDDVEVVVTIDKRSGSIVGIGAALREPMRVLLGLAHVTDLDVDFRLTPVTDGGTSTVAAGSSARMKIMRFGRAVEYYWSGFKGVAPAGP